MKLAAWHASDPRRQRNKRADHREQARDEHRRVTPARKKTIGPVEFAVTHQDPAAIALHQRTSSVMADFIRDQRSQVAADGARGRDPEEIHAAFVNQVAGERHDEFGWKRNAGGLNRHQDGDPGVAGGSNHGFDEDEQDSEDFFSHAIEVAA